MQVVSKQADVRCACSDLWPCVEVGVNARSSDTAAGRGVMRASVGRSVGYTCDRPRATVDAIHIEGARAVWRIVRCGWWRLNSRYLQGLGACL